MAPRSSAGRPMAARLTHAAVLPSVLVEFVSRFDADELPDLQEDQTAATALHQPRSGDGDGRAG